MVDIEHNTLATTNMHVPGYQQSSDPGAVGAGIQWVDTSGGTGKWILKVRNAADTGWEFPHTHILMEGGNDSDHTLSSSNTDEWHTTTHTIAGVGDGDNIEIVVNACCYADMSTGYIDYAYFKLRISLDNGSSWVIYDNWSYVSSFRRLPHALTSFRSGTVSTALKVQLGFRQARSAPYITFSKCYYSVITKVLN